MRASKLSFIFILFAINFTAQNLTREERIEIIELFAKFKYPTTPEEALVITDKVLAIDSSNITAIGYKAISYFRKKDYHEALKNFNWMQKINQAFSKTKKYCNYYCLPAYLPEQ